MSTKSNYFNMANQHHRDKLLAWCTERVGRVVSVECSRQGASPSWVHYEGTLAEATPGVFVLQVAHEEIPFGHPGWLYRAVKALDSTGLVLGSRPPSRPPSPTSSPVDQEADEVIAIAKHAFEVAEVAASAAADNRGNIEALARSHDELVVYLQTHLKDLDGQQKQRDRDRDLVLQQHEQQILMRQDANAQKQQDLIRANEQKQKDLFRANERKIDQLAAAVQSLADSLARSSISSARTVSPSARDPVETAKQPTSLLGPVSKQQHSPQLMRRHALPEPSLPLDTRSQSFTVPVREDSVITPLWPKLPPSSEPRQSSLSMSSTVDPMGRAVIALAERAESDDPVWSSHHLGGGRHILRS